MRAVTSCGHEKTTAIASICACLISGMKGRVICTIPIHKIRNFNTAPVATAVPILKYAIRLRLSNDLPVIKWIAVTNTKLPAIINGIIIGNAGIPSIRNAPIGEITAITAADGNPTKIADVTKRKFTQEPVTNCPKGLVIACTDTSNAMNMAVCAIHRIRFLYIIITCLFLFILI